MGMARTFGATFNLRWKAIGAVFLGSMSLSWPSSAACVGVEHEAAVRSAVAGSKFSLALEPCLPLDGGLPVERTSDLPAPVRRIAPPPALVTSERRVFLDWAPATHPQRAASPAVVHAPSVAARAVAASLPPFARPPSVSREASSRALMLSPQINAVAAEYRIDPLLLHSIAHVESRHNLSAVSHADARGLMQVMPDIARRFGVTDPHTQLFDPKTSLQVSATYLKWLQARFNNNLTLVIAAYNAGEGAVEKHGNVIPPYRETQEYVKSVLSHYLWLRGADGSAPVIRQAQVNP